MFIILYIQKNGRGKWIFVTYYILLKIINKKIIQQLSTSESYILEYKKGELKKVKKNYKIKETKEKI